MFIRQQPREPRLLTDNKTACLLGIWVVSGHGA
jgi:hypothetical protein